jgi:hypothetical protein
MRRRVGASLTLTRRRLPRDRPGRLIAGLDPAIQLVLGSTDGEGLPAGKTALGAFGPGHDELNFQKTHQNA